MKKKIKNFLAMVIFVLGIIASCWLSIGVLLVGGVEQTIAGLQAQNVSMAVWGLLRAMCCELGFLVFWIGLAISASLTE